MLTENNNYCLGPFFFMFTLSSQISCLMKHINVKAAFPVFIQLVWHFYSFVKFWNKFISVKNILLYNKWPVYLQEKHSQKGAERFSRAKQVYFRRVRNDKLWDLNTIAHYKRLKVTTFLKNSSFKKSFLCNESDSLRKEQMDNH